MRLVQTDTVNPVGRVAAWLFRTARNRIIDHSRKRREERMPQMHGRDDESGFVSEITALLADESSSPEMGTSGRWSGRRSRKPSANFLPPSATCSS
ncbi:MAG: RNA polymerase sigma factor [Alistipes finegoldii]